MQIMEESRWKCFSKLGAMKIRYLISDVCYYGYIYVNFCGAAAAVPVQCSVLMYIEVSAV